MKVNDIMCKALKLGACAQSSKATDWKSLIWLFFSPQGREFCNEHNFPSLEVFRGMKPHVREYKTYVEESIKVCNQDAALIGESESELSYSGIDKTYTVILMHGAKADIHAGNYAVVRLENISGECTITNDGTAKILE